MLIGSHLHPEGAAAVNHPVPTEPPSHPEWQARRPAPLHPLHLPPEALRSIRDLSVAAAHRAAELEPLPARPPVRRPEPVEIYRAEPERFSLWPWLGPIARVVLVALACAGILALGYIAIVGFAAWSGGR